MINEADAAPGRDLIVPGLPGHEIINGTAGNDVLRGGPGDDVISGFDGSDDIADFVGGNDQLYGGAGDDFLTIRRDLASSVGPSTVLLDGGDGNDQIMVYAAYQDRPVTATIYGGAGDDVIGLVGRYVHATIDAGAGNDQVNLFSLEGPVITLGAGQNTVRLLTLGDFHFDAPADIKDFATGDSGDIVDLSNFFGADFSNHVNPFADGHLELVQSGPDTILKVDINGNDGLWVDAIRFENTQVAAFTAYNFFGAAPNGGALVGGTIIGTDKAEYINATGDQSVLAGGGDDTITVTGHGPGVFNGGDGNDTFHLTNIGVQATLTLGAGSDTVTLDTQQDVIPLVTITDFQVGAGGDRLDFQAYLAAAETGAGWDGTSDPFALGFVRLTASGSDTLVQMKAADGWHSLFDLKNVAPSTLVGANLSGYDPNGQAPAGQTIIGEDGPNILTGTPGPDIIFGGPQSDIINGGAGNDVIDGRGAPYGGGDTVTGGPGSDTFIFRSGYGDLTITDFTPGVDHIDIYGYSSARAIADLPGGTCEIVLSNAAQVLSNADTIYLTGVSASSLTAADIVFHPLAALPPAPPTPVPNVAVTNLVDATADVQVAQGQTVYFTGAGYWLDIPFPYSGPAPTLTNAGTITAIASAQGGQAVGINNIGDAANFQSASVDNLATGTLAVEGAGSAYGVWGGSWSSSIDNAGLIQVVSPQGDAHGILVTPSVINEVGGVIDVWGMTSAIAVRPNGGVVANHGLIEVAGYHAIAVESAVSLDNSGTITAVQNGPSWQSIGSIGDYIDAWSAPSLTNSGTITADYAVFVEPGFATAAPGDPAIYAAPVSVTNSGHLDGKVSLSAGDNTVVNTGDIAGAVSFGDGANVYNGVGGTQSGGIYLGAGTNRVMLGNDGEFVFGGGGSDTITGGAGADYVEIGSGADVLDGGGGFNTLSFALATTGVTVDLATGTASVGASQDTLKNFQEIIGSPFNDVIVGGPGNDVIEGGPGNDTLTGGGGNNTFIFSTGDGQDVITDFKANGDKDVLEIFGYSGPLSVQQQGSDTLVQLSSADTILLKGVQASSLTASDIVYSTSAAPVPAGVPPAPPPLGAATLNLDRNFTVPAGETINEVGHIWGIVDNGRSTGVSLTGPVSLTNDGVINVSAHYWVAGFASGAGPSPAVFTNAAGATFSVSNLGTTVGATHNGFIWGAAGDAIGVEKDSWGPNLTNAGLFTVQAVNGDAFGVVSYDPQFTFVNSGVYQVTASGTADGLLLYNGGNIENTGSITATGAIANGVESIEQNGYSFGNTGSIIATATGGNAVALNISMDFYKTIYNSGLLKGDYSLKATAANGGVGNLTVINSGTMQGDISLGFLTGQIDNTGVIEGNVTLGSVGHNVYDGTGGQLIGSISGSTGNATIIGGLGTTLVTFDVASSQASLTQNADGSWALSAPGISADTLVHVQAVQFTDKTVTLATPSTIAPHDFNGDGMSDVLFGQTNGTLAVWEMNGTTIAGGGAIGAPGGTWAEKGVGDFNGDGKADVLFQDGSGALAIWEMNGTSIVGGGSIGNPGGTWAEKGVGDFNGDGKADILFQDGSGNLAIWEMNGTAIVGGGAIGNPGGTWHVDGVGDFNGDGKADILFQDASGNLAVWEMNGTSIIGGGSIGNPGGTWAFKGIGDFNGDGKSDILFQDASGNLAIWDINGTQIIGGGAIGNPGGAWSFAGIGDYSGDGKADILFQDASGNLAIWEMNDTHIIGGGTIGNPGAVWHILS